MLLDLLQGAPIMHAGASGNSLPSLSEDLSFTDILSSCLSDGASSTSLLHILQEGIRVPAVPADNFLHTHPTSTESQISLPLNYTHPLCNASSKHHDENVTHLHRVHLNTATQPAAADIACLQRRIPQTSAVCRLQSSCKRSKEAPEPTSSATSELSTSTLENMVEAGGEFAGQSQALRHLNCSFQCPISQAVNGCSAGNALGAQRTSTQTSLDEESSIQISIQESKSSAAHPLNMGEEIYTCPATTDVRTHVGVELDSCSPDNRLACDVRRNRPAAARNAAASRKRKRTRVCKNSEEVESQRMTHIAVERNRRKQMNEHLNVLRSLMPATYIQRGDQASIVGGAIDFVKELEHVLQALQIKKQRADYDANPSLPNQDSALVLGNLLLKPHYKPRSTKCSYIETPKDIFAHLTYQGVDVEVKLIGSRALVKVLAQKSPHQLLKVASFLENFHLKILHLNITTIEESVLYAFNLEVQSDSQTLNANDIAQSIQNTFKL